MTIEMVDLPIKHGDFPVRYLSVYQRVVSSLITVFGKNISAGNYTSLITHHFLWLISHYNDWY
jgi:hypothetical protein